ncbi:MAG TPA: HD-GYP domain-containing protein [Phycisphaerae bacterium]|nr:HD-GYP domain-containing protein [Phycisphaerae bacterium]
MQDVIERTTNRPAPGPAEDAEREMLRCLTRLEVQLRRSYLESTRALVATVEARDVYTHQHSARVARLCRCIAQRLRLSAGQIECIVTAAMLHDIGKIGVPDAILNKPGPLTEDEFDFVKRHPAIGVEILGHTTYLQNELPLILHHHERADGSGYPGGLRGDEIPFGARILAVADALDTMVTRRSYKAPMAMKQVRRELVVGRGLQFDEAVADATLAWLDDPHDAQACAFRTTVTGG